MLIHNDINTFLNTILALLVLTSTVVIMNGSFSLFQNVCQYFL